MTGHVIYACPCLNVQIQLANKYYLEGHEAFRKEKFIRLEQPRLSGWIFEPGKGISITYPSLIRIQKKDDWYTIKCHNCTTEVCSIERKDTEELETVRRLPGDRLMIHQKTIFGQAIADLSKKPTYSDIFQVILNPDLPMEYLDIDKDKNVSPALEPQYEHVQQLLKKSYRDLECQTELKIQAFQEEQKMHLAREKEKANYDAAVLWQTMKEVSKTSTNAQCLSGVRPIFKVSYDHATFDRVDQVEQQSLSLRDLSMDAKEYDMFRTEQHSEHHPIEYLSHELDPNHFVNQRRRRSSAFKTSNRRSSYILDESAIANSLKKISHPHHPLVPVPERRRSSFNLQPPRILGSSESSSSWEDEPAKEEDDDDDDDDSEEMFPLDEDIPENSIFNPSKRRESKKYLDINDDYEEEEESKIDQDKEGEGSDSKLGIPQISDYTIACSVPISINRPSQLNQSNSQWNQSNSQLNQSNYSSNGTTISTKPKQTFLGFDYAKADREVSSHLPPIDNNYRRKSIANGVLMSNLLSNTQDDKIIPPHILVANTYTEGSETLFGSVPRGSVRYGRPVE